VKMPENATTNLLFSSGTTGTPKGITWTMSSPIKSAVDSWTHFDVKEGEVVAWPTNLGWMMGPWLLYQLLNNATIALFHDTPVSARFCKFVEKSKMNFLGVIPAIVNAWKAKELKKGCDWSEIKRYGSTGEASDPITYHWLVAQASYKPVMEYCGGTEIGGGYVCGTMVQPQVLSAFSSPTLGLDFILLDEENEVNESGDVYILGPSLGCSTTLVNKDHFEVYYEDCPSGPNGEVLRRHGDFFLNFGKGYWKAHGRSDDTMNLNGIKISSVELEQAAISNIEGIKEVAAIGYDKEGPTQLVIVFKLYDGFTLDITNKELQKQFQTNIKKNLNPLFRVSDVMKIEEMPRTASGKLMRRILRKCYSENLTSSTEGIEN